MSIHFTLHFCPFHFLCFPRPQSARRDLNLWCGTLSGAVWEPRQESHVLPHRHGWVGMLGFAFQKFQGKPEPGASCSPSRHPRSLWGGSCSGKSPIAWCTGAALGIWHLLTKQLSSHRFPGGTLWSPYLTKCGRGGCDPALNMQQENDSKGLCQFRSCFQMCYQAPNLLKISIFSTTIG